MAEGQSKSPDDSTQSLAESILKAATEGRDLSQFREKINAMSNQDRLQLVKDLKETKDASFSRYAEQQLFIDAHIDKETNELIDLDIVSRKGGENPVERRMDIFTPGEKGRAFDKQQEIEETLAPYRQLFTLMNQNDALKAATGEPVAESETNLRNMAEVRRLLKEHYEDHPDIEMLLAEIDRQESTIESGFTSVYSFETAMAGSLGYANAPEEIKERLDRLISENLELGKGHHDST